MTFMIVMSVCDLLTTAVHTERETHTHTHTHACSLQYQEIRNQKKSRIEQQSLQRGLEGEMSLTAREAQHLRKAFEFQREQQQGRRR